MSLNRPGRIPVYSKIMGYTDMNKIYFNESLFERICIVCTLRTNQRVKHTQIVKIAPLCIVYSAQNAPSVSKLYTNCENSTFVYSLQRSERAHCVKTIHKL